jgi:hypothetical protein
MKNNFKNNNSGQVLLIVVVALAVTLGVGLGVTSRNTASLKRTGNLDSFQKVTVAAEGALEKYLLKNDTDLDAMVNTLSPATPEELFPESKTKAVVTVSKLKAGDLGMVYEKIKPSESVSFLTTEYSSSEPSTPASSVCLRFEAVPTNVTYMINVLTSNPSKYTITGLPYTNQTLPAMTVDEKKAAGADRQLSNAYRHETYLASGNSLNTVATNCSGSNNSGYKFTNASMVRIQPLSGELTQLTVKVLDVTSNIKNITQGYKISAVGRFSDSLDKTTRTVEAYKYLDTPSGIYDYAVFLDN